MRIVKDHIDSLLGILTKLSKEYFQQCRLLMWLDQPVLQSQFSGRASRIMVKQSSDLIDAVPVVEFPVSQVFKFQLLKYFYRCLVVWCMVSSYKFNSFLPKKISKFDRFIDLIFNKIKTTKIWAPKWTKFGWPCRSNN